jgi:hypothetical protein
MMEDEPRFEGVEWVSEEEIRTLILSLGTARKGSSFSETECAALVEWAEQVRIDAQLLKMALAGDLLVDMREGGPLFITAPGRGPRK